MCPHESEICELDQYVSRHEKKRKNVAIESILQNKQRSNVNVQSVLSPMYVYERESVRAQLHEFLLRFIMAFGNVQLISMIRQRLRGSLVTQQGLPDEDEASSNLESFGDKMHTLNLRYNRNHPKVFVCYESHSECCIKACSVYQTEHLYADFLDMLFSPKHLKISLTKSDVQFLHEYLFKDSHDTLTMFYIGYFLASFNRMKSRSLQNDERNKLNGPTSGVNCIAESNIDVTVSEVCEKNANVYNFTRKDLFILENVLKVLSIDSGVEVAAKNENVSLKDKRSMNTIDLKTERYRTPETTVDDSNDALKTELRYLTNQPYACYSECNEYTVAPVSKDSEIDGSRSGEQPTESEQGAYFIQSDSTATAQYSEPPESKISVDGQSHSRPTLSNSDQPSIKAALIISEPQRKENVSSVYEENVVAKEESNALRKQRVGIQQERSSAPSAITEAAEAIVSEPTCEVNVFPNVVGNALPTPGVDDTEVRRFEPLMDVIDKMADGQRVPPQITMQYEMLRFCTLRSFPKENKPYITRLAQAGFYYANSGDELVCYCCARRKRNWCEDDKPIDIHRELNPNCSFLIRNAEVNVPIKTAENSLQNLTLAAHAQTLNNGRSGTLTSTTASGNTRQPSHETSTHMGPTSAVQNNSDQVNTISSDRSQTRAHGNFVQATAASSPAQAGQLDQSSITRSSTESSLTAALRNAAEGVNTPAMPKYPKYASKTVRISSFNDCSDIVIPPDRLADAGFFYAGFGDCTRCFQCGAGLRHWSEEDDPWIEHSRWSKDCSFVRQIKGPEFVNIVQMAVQYSQNQENEDEQTTGENPTGTNNNEANLGVNVDNLMHTDAAQSVLEMGYHPNLIRRAIRLIKEANGDANMTAANVMEKVFELEEADSSANEQQNDQPLQQSQNADLQTTTATPTVRATSDNMTRNHQRSAELTSHASISSSPSNSVAVDSTKSASTQSGGKEMTRAQKKMQLLEQKKLKEENKKLKQQSICTKCHQNDVCIVFLPCGHLVTCETCAPTVRYCTVQGCGKYIKGTVRTYLA